MKLKIKVKYNNTHIPKLRIYEKGDWVDLYAERDGSYSKGELTKISLGVAMQLPKGFEAIMLPRSSSAKIWGFILSNSQGVIDQSFKGNKDIWQCPVLFFRDSNITIFDRICQFRIQLSQKATVWDKLRWLISSGIEFIEVSELEDKARGGFGKSGKSGIPNSSK